MKKALTIAGLLASGIVHAQTQEVGQKADLSKFRYSLAEMQKIANPKLLSHRIFYETKSIGPNAGWFDAVKQGNLAEVKKMVEAQGTQHQKKLLLEARDDASMGQTALGWAAFIGYLDMVKYLVSQGADVRATDKADVYNSVKSAVMGPNVEVVKYLSSRLNKGEIDWNAREIDNETLFSVAAVDGRYDTVKSVSDNFHPDISVVAKNDNPKIDESPLSGACDGGFTDVANLLISKGAINHKTGKSSCN